MRGAGPVDETTLHEAAGQRPRLPATSVGSSGTDHEMTVPGGTASSFCSTSSTTRSSLASSVATSAYGRPVSSGSSRNSGPSLTMMQERFALGELLARPPERCG